MGGQTRVIAIPKEDAVFWLDKDGRWRNEGGRFRHKKIIDHFHASITKDADGYFVMQEKGDVLEKVYFRYEDTAIFVFDISEDNGTTLILNTRKRIKLNPVNIYLQNDNLYVMDAGEKIKFAEHALIKISKNIEEKGGKLLITIDGVQYKIHEKF